MPKHKLTLSIDKKVINQAKKQNINLSSFLEIRLVDYLNYKECSRWDSNLSSWLERPEWLVGLHLCSYHLISASAHPNLLIFLISLRFITIATVLVQLNNITFNDLILFSAVSIIFSTSGKLNSQFAGSNNISGWYSCNTLPNSEYLIALSLPIVTVDFNENAFWVLLN